MVVLAVSKDGVVLMICLVGKRVGVDVVVDGSIGVFCVDDLV